MNTGNTQFERDFESFLSGDDARLEALYRKLPAAEPDASLDATVQAMARRALAATKPATRAPSHRRRLPILSAAAVVALAAGIAFQIGPQMWQRPTSERKVEPPAAPTALPAAAPQPAAPEPSAQKATSAPAAAPVEQAPITTLKKVENAASRPAPRAFPAPASALRESAPPPATAEAKPMAQAPAMAAPMRAKQQADVESAGAPVQALAAPAAQDSNASLYPEHWLANIRQMLHNDQREEALRSLAEFRKRYPDYRLPDDLRDLH